MQPAKATAADEEQYLGEYVFRMAANSSNPEVSGDVADNQMEIRVPLSVTADWKVTGKSEPAIVEYNITEPLPEKYKVEDQIGPEVVHIYDVKNKGPATIKEAEVFIMWPSFTKDDQRHLLYLLGVNYDKSKVTCQNINNINPLYIKTKESVGYAEALQQVLEEEAEMGVRKVLYSSSSSSSSSTSYSSGGSSWSSGGSRTSYTSSSSNNGGSSYQTSGGGRRTEESQNRGGTTSQTFGGNSR